MGQLKGQLALATPVSGSGQDEGFRGGWTTLSDKL